VINSLAPDVPLSRTYGGALPFVFSDLIRVAILILFPTITLGLVRLLH
jgi:TRAP-type mannitol/chloroaromatic compound transport system permease large subunit